MMEEELSIATHCSIAKAYIALHKSSTDWYLHIGLLTSIGYQGWEENIC